MLSQQNASFLPGLLCILFYVLQVALIPGCHTQNSSCFRDEAGFFKGVYVYNLPETLKPSKSEFNRSPFNSGKMQDQGDSHLLVEWACSQNGQN